MNAPQVSMVVPIYNVESFLEKSISHLLNQTFTDFELILIDDGSKDKSGEICDKYALKDNRIKVTHKENGGAGSARNAGIEIAIGEYIMFPDADDLVYGNMLEIVVAEITKKSVELVIFSYENICIEGETIIVKNRNKLLNKTIIDNKIECRKLWFDVRKINIGQLNSPCNKLYKLNIIKDNNIRFPDIRRAQDAVFNLKYYDKVSSISVIDEILYRYNENDEEKVWMKFPKNSIDYFVEYNRVMEEVITSWEMFYGEYKTLCDNNLIGNIHDCFLLCHNPKWNLNHRSKVEYIYNIIQIPYIQQRFQNYLGNIDELSKYVNHIRQLKAKKIYMQIRLDQIEDRIRRCKLLENKLINNICRIIYRKIKSIKLSK